MSSDFFMAITLPFLLTIAAVVASIVFLPLWAAVIAIFVAMAAGFLVVIGNCLPRYRG